MTLKSESPAITVADSLNPSELIYILLESEICYKTSVLLFPSIKYISIFIFNNLQENPILMAVSVLSPVKTQTLIPAFFILEIAKSTSSYSLSSIAVAPRSSKFYSSLSATSSHFSSLFFIDVYANLYSFTQSSYC